MTIAISESGLGLASLSYVLLSGIGGLAASAEIPEVQVPTQWAHGVADVSIQSGLIAIAAAPYVMKASEEESFFKALRRSQRIVHKGMLR